MPNDKVIQILTRLGFGPKQNGEQITCSVPTWRSDVYREADLIEEIARVYGYDKIPAENKITIEVAPVDTRKKTIDAIGTYLDGMRILRDGNNQLHRQQGRGAIRSKRR